MSEGRTSPETLQEQWKPTLEDINLLHEIVIRAQKDPLLQHSTKDALLNAYTAVFTEHGLQAEKDKVCCWTLLKIIDPNGPPGTLYEKFEKILEDEGIELSFDDDEASEDVGARPYSTLRFSPQKHKSPRRKRQRPYSEQADIILPSQKPLQQLTSTVNDFALPTETVSENVGSESVFDDGYVDNPPPHISQLMQIAEAMDNKTLLRQSLAVLRPRGLGLMEARADLHYEDGLRLKAWSQWRAVTHSYASDCANADTYYVKRLKSKHLRRLIDAARVHRMRAMEEERLKGMALYKLALSSREAQYRRGIDTMLKAKYLGKLMHRFQAHQYNDMQLQPLLQQYEADSRPRLLRPALAALAAKSRDIVSYEHVADRLHDNRLKRNMITKWYWQAETIKRMRSTAEDARRHYLMRKYLFKLHDIAQAKRARRLVLAKWTLNRWQNYLDAKKHHKYDEAYRTIRRKVKMNLARRLLQQWTQRSRQVQHQNTQATEIHDTKVKSTAHKAITIIYERSQTSLQMVQTAQNHADKLALKHTLLTITERQKTQIAMNEVADRFYKLHTQTTASKCLKSLNMKSFEIRRRQRDAEAFQRRHDKKILRITLDRMRNVASQSRGEEPLNLPPATPAQRRAKELSRLAATASTTPIYTPAARALFAARLRGESKSAFATASVSGFRSQSRFSTGLGRLEAEDYSVPIEQNENEQENENGDENESDEVGIIEGSETS